MERRRVLFAGRVQGVGFRYRTLEIARRHPQITGFVRNLPDGRVELVVEGPAAATAAMVAEVAETLASFIEHAETTTSSATGEFERFEIRY